MIIGSEVKELRGRGVKDWRLRVAAAAPVAIAPSSLAPLKLGSCGCQAFAVLVRVGALKQRMT